MTTEETANAIDGKLGRAAHSMAIMRIGEGLIKNALDGIEILGGNGVNCLRNGLSYVVHSDAEEERRINVMEQQYALQVQAGGGYVVPGIVEDEFIPYESNIPKIGGVALTHSPHPQLTRHAGGGIVCLVLEYTFDDTALELTYDVDVSIVSFAYGTATPGETIGSQKQFSNRNPQDTPSGSFFQYYFLDYYEPGGVPFNIGIQFAQKFTGPASTMTIVGNDPPTYPAPYHAVTAT